MAYPSTLGAYLQAHNLPGAAVCLEGVYSLAWMGEGAPPTPACGPAIQIGN